MVITAIKKTDSGLAIVEYQFHEWLRNQVGMKLAVVTDGTLDYMMSGRKANLIRREIKLDNNPYFLYHDKTIEFHNPPIRGSHDIKGSPDSSAEYFIYDDATGILFQHLPRGSTSRNYHTKGNEIFYNLAGDCRVCNCLYTVNSYKGDIVLKKKIPFIVKPYECHQLHASLNPVVNIILMPPGVGRSDHHYPEKCIKELYFLLAPNTKKLCYLPRFSRREDVLLLPRKAIGVEKQLHLSL